MTTVLEIAPESIRKIDAHNMASLLQNFPSQLKDACAIGESIRFAPEFGKNIRNVVSSGVGGSAIGADVVKGYLQGEMECPVLVNRNYTLPAFVGKESLVILSSYSGNTEETLAVYAEARKRSAQIVSISSGGEIEKLSLQYGTPHVRIPGGLPPRLALGYSVVPILHLLNRLGLIALRPEEFRETLEVIEAQRKEYESGSSENNEAKRLASALFKKYPIFYASEHFRALALRWRAQMEENAKALASHLLLPEMNHNEIVGWENPPDLLKNFAAVFLRDHDEHPRVQLRIQLTKQILSQKAGTVIEIFPRGKSLLARMFSLSYLADFTTFYLAIHYGVDPTPIKVIDYLKSELARVSS